MDTDRRKLIAAGTALTALLASGACSVQKDDAKDKPEPAAADGKPGAMEIIHIYADEYGVSHFRRVQVVGLPKPLPGATVVANAIAPGVEDWHVAPRKTFTINTAGDIEGELGDGTKVAIGKGDLVYLEDREGKGHITRLLTNVANLFIQMPDDFDFTAWVEAGNRMENAFG